MLDQARQFHQVLPERIRSYMRSERGLTDEIIDRHLLGWNGSRITIPIFDREASLAFIKLAKDPEDKSDSPKMLAPAGSRVELYGWEQVLAKHERIVICEGEYDRLLLESRGLAAVTSTGGAGVFRAEWAEAFKEISQVYVCFDNDEAGQAGASYIARLVPHARIVTLPAEVGEGGDVTDFFVRLGKSTEEFEVLLQAAKPLPPKPEPTPQPRFTGSSRANSEVADLKSQVQIQDIIGSYLTLYPSGRYLSARCPFHSDSRPSFVVYPATQSFRCYGCQEHGDVISFLMRMEKLTFPEALGVLKQLVPTYESRPKTHN